MRLAHRAHLHAARARASTPRRSSSPTSIEHVIRPLLPEQFADDDFEVLRQPDRRVRARRPARRLRAHRPQDHRRHLRRHGPPRRRRVLGQGPDQGRPLGRLRGALGREERRRRRARPSAARSRSRTRSASPTRCRSWSRRSAPRRSTRRSIAAAVREVFDLRPAAIIRDLDLRRPIYQRTAAYGHFGRAEKEFTWEHTTRLDDLRSAPRPVAPATTRRPGPARRAGRSTRRSTTSSPTRSRRPVRVGAIVRVPLHGRRSAAGSSTIDVVATCGREPRRADRRRGMGPPPRSSRSPRGPRGRWAGRDGIRPDRRRRRLLSSHASRPRRWAPFLRAADSRISHLKRFDAPGAVVRLPPPVDHLPLILAAARLGPALVVTPSVGMARALAGARAPCRRGRRGAPSGLGTGDGWRGRHDRRAAARCGHRCGTRPWSS